MHDENKCSKIVSKSLAGNYVIEGNRRTWYTEDGKRYTEIGPQYRGTVWIESNDGKMCPNGYHGSAGLFG